MTKQIPLVSLMLVVLSASVAVGQEPLWREIETATARFRSMAMEDARKLPPIKALRDAYRMLGNDPTRYRGSQGDCAILGNLV